MLAALLIAAWSFIVLQLRKSKKLKKLVSRFRKRETNGDQKTV